MANRPRIDSPQMDLLGGLGGGLGTPPSEVHSLFLALLPNDATRAALDRVADDLRARQPHWRGRWVDPARYHATLHFLGDHADHRPDLVAVVIAAAEKIDATAFTWTLDHADSFHGRQPPCVLLGAEVPELMQTLWEQWRRALILAGQGTHLARRYTPHVTLAYGQESRRETTPIEPVPWVVEEVALVRSVAGRPAYEILARWSFGAHKTPAQ